MIWFYQINLQYYLAAILKSEQGIVKTFMAKVKLCG